MRTRAVVLLVLVLGIYLPAGAAVGVGDSPPTDGTMLPGTVAVDGQIQRQVIQALHSTAKDTNGATQYAVTDLRSEIPWQLVSVAGFGQTVSEQSWTLDDAVWVGLVLLHQDRDGRWAGAVEGTDAFRQMLSSVPDSILDPEAKEGLDPGLDSAVTTEQYVFPWEPGTRMQYGMLGVHDAGFVSGWKAVDFFSDGNTALGHAQNRLLAAAPGTISYVCRDGISVAVRIGDLMYVHLLDNSNLVLGHTFDLREELGQLKTGGFGEVGVGCGWARQGDGWFHVHWGFPDTGTFTANCWTLNLLDGLWRRNGDVAGIYDWFEADGTTPSVGTTGRSSVASGGSEGSGGSYGASISADGRFVAFSSSAEDLVPGDTNNAVDVFLHDRHTGTTERISVSGSGMQGNGLSSEPAISADGRFVAFWSSATNLVSGDSNGLADIFVRDRASGHTELVSVSSEGLQADNFSYNPAVSDNGRYVVFSSFATNLVSGDTNKSADIFLHDRDTHLTSLLSISGIGLLGDGDSVAPSISADGRYVAFWSSAANLVPEDKNDQPDLFRQDRLTGDTLRVSVASDGSQAVGATAAPLPTPALSADGRFIVFHSGAWNLVDDDANAADDIFVHDCQTGATQRVSISSSSIEANAWSRFPVISRDGRYVAFASAATNLVCNDSNARTDIFRHDRQTGRTDLISVHTDGTQGDDDSAGSAISATGRYVAFDSLAGNLVTDDDNGSDDVLVHDQDGTWPYTASGRIVHPNLLPVPDVAVSAGALLTTTDSSGNYAFSLHVDGTYTLTPSLEPFVFWPRQLTVRVPSDAPGSNYTMLASPISTTLPPTSTTSLTYLDTQGLTTTLTFPVGSVSQTLTLALTPTLTPHLGGSAFTGHAFQLTAQHDGTLLPESAFSLPVTVTITYSLADVRLVNAEDELALYIQTTAGWDDAADTCTPPQHYQRYSDSGLLTVLICRTGTFGLYGPTHRSNLPLVLWRR